MNGSRNPDECRTAREVGAYRFVRDVLRQVEATACRCVRTAVDAGATDAELLAILREAERRLQLRLFIWEVSGTPAAAEEAGEARELVLKAWGAITRTSTGSHTCYRQEGSARRGGGR